MAVPVRRDLLAWTSEQEARLTAALTQGLTRRGQRLTDLARALPRPAALLDTPNQRLDRAAEKLPAALTARVRQGEVRLQKAAGGLRPGLVRARTARLGDRLDGLGHRLGAALARPAGEKRRAFAKLAARLDASRIIEARGRKARDLDALVRRLVLAGETRGARDRARLETLERTHQTLGYRETLKRGYAVVRGDGAVVMTKVAAEKAGALEIEFSDGRLALDETAKPSVKKTKPKSPPPEQGSLF
jgi:exodeoxyribonuclease VII large subunit